MASVIIHDDGCNVVSEVLDSKIGLLDLLPEGWHSSSKCETFLFMENR